MLCLSTELRQLQAGSSTCAGTAPAIKAFFVDRLWWWNAKLFSQFMVEFVQYLSINFQYLSAEVDDSLVLLFDARVLAIKLCLQVLPSG